MKKNMQTRLNPLTLSLTPNRLALAFSFVAVAGSSSVMAQADNKYDLSSDWYGGVNIGQTRESINDGLIANNELNGGLSSISDDKRDHGFKFFAGYHLSENLALEAGYFDLGEFGSYATNSPSGALSTRTKTRGFNLDVVGSYPFNDRLSAFARVGVHYSEAKDRFQGIGGVVVADTHRRERDTNFKWGGGLQYDFNQRLGMRVEVERYAINDVMGNNGAINLVSLGAVYRFGDARRARVADEPETRREQLRKEYCTTLDIKFAIDSDEIERAGLEQLTAVGEFLKKYQDTRAVIEGHTDNVGSDEYNMDLSRRRAESALDFLVREQRVTDGQVSAVGYGETRPIASNDTEEGKRANRRVNASVTCANDVEGAAPPEARVTMGTSLEFDDTSTEVKSEFHAELAKVATFLRDNKNVTAVIEGHAADLQNAPERARTISEQRAQNVMEYLVNKEGIAASRLSAEGFGKSRRYAYNDSADGKKDNRRVTIIFTYPKQ